MPSTEHLPAVTPDAVASLPGIRRASDPVPVTVDVDMAAVLRIVFFITSLASGTESKWEAEARAG
jgi:hypothetical protein